MKIHRCKGMRDLSPAEMKIFRLVEDTCRDCCLKWGYGEVRTPTLEYLHLFTSAGTLTPNMLGKVYSFLDWDGWSGERVVLRPDGTIPVARLYTESQPDGGLARLFYAANMFIFEEDAAKTRERWQCGAELIGEGSALTDAELIALSREVLKKLDINGVELRLSHAGLIKALLEKLSLSLDERDCLFDRILDGDAAVLEEVGGKNPELVATLRPLLDLKGQSPSFLRNQRDLLAGSLPEVRQPLDDFLSTVAVLEDLGIDYRIDLASGAGFEYYTGVIFQYFIGEEKMGGGGRYDALIPSMGGREVPASGFALYIDRLMGMVKPSSFEKIPASVMVRVKSAKAIREAFETAAALRKADYITMLDIGGAKSTPGWNVDVSPGSLVLSGGSKSLQLKLKTVEEVLARLEEESAGQDSPT